MIQVIFPISYVETQYIVKKNTTIFYLYKSTTDSINFKFHFLFLLEISRKRYTIAINLKPAGYHVKNKKCLGDNVHVH